MGDAKTGDMMRQPTLTEVLLVFIDRYQKDRKAQEAFVDKTATTLAQVTLDSFMKNVATELQTRYGILLEGLSNDSEVCTWACPSEHPGCTEDRCRHVAPPFYLEAR